MDGTQIKTLRETASLSRLDFAKRLNISRAMVSALEHDKRVARGPLLLLLQQMQGRYRRKLEAVE